MGSKQKGCPIGMVDAERIAAVFGLEPETVARGARKGTFPPAALRIGRKLFWPESVIDELRARFTAAVDVHHNMKQEAA